MDRQTWLSKFGEWYVPEPNTGCWLWMRFFDGGETVAKELTPREIFDRAMALPDFWDRLKPYCFILGRGDLRECLDRIGEHQRVWLVRVEPVDPEWLGYRETG